MKILSSAGALIALSAVVMPVRAAEDAGLARMALCQDSWFDWSKTDPQNLKVFAEHFRANFSHKGNDVFSTSRTESSVLGLHIAQVYPESVGMGVGFSILVDAPFDVARKTMERVLGKKLNHCEASDGMHSCESEIAERRTVTLMSEDVSMKKQALIGCYYFYEK